jgi:hypothetical protein
MKVTCDIVNANLLEQMQKHVYAIQINPMVFNPVCNNHTFIYISTSSHFCFLDSNYVTNLPLVTIRLKGV